MEQIDLTAPEIKPTNNYYRINKLYFIWDTSHILIELIGQNGEEKEFSYSGIEAQNMMIALNKMDLSVKSLHRRIMEKLISDGLIGGVIAGTAD